MATAILARERDYQNTILDAARMCGWRTAHFRPARTKHGWTTAVAGDGAGFPDLVLARSGVVVFRELKTDSGRLTEAQRHWLDVLPDAGVWRPNDWGEVEAIIDGG